MSIVECVKEFRNILFGYPIIVYSDHKNLVHAATVSQSQRVMRWHMILEEFGPDIHHISGEENVVADAISRLPTANTEQRDVRNVSQVLQDEIRSAYFGEIFNLVEDHKSFPLDVSLVQKEQQNELNQQNSKLKDLVNTKDSGYYIGTFWNHELVLHENKLYVPKSLRQRVLNWYHFYKT